MNRLSDDSEICCVMKKSGRGERNAIAGEKAGNSKRKDKFMVPWKWRIQYAWRTETGDFPEQKATEPEGAPSDEGKPGQQQL